MASDTQIQKLGGITAAMVLQTVGGILIAVLAWNVNEITKRLEKNEEAVGVIIQRVTVTEQQSIAATRNSEDFKQDVRRAAERAEDQMRRLNEKVDRISEAVGAKKL